MSTNIDSDVHIGTTRAISLASFALGVAGLVAWSHFPFSWLLGVAAVATGLIARRRIQASGEGAGTRLSLGGVIVGGLVALAMTPAMVVSIGAFFEFLRLNS